MKYKEILIVLLTSITTIFAIMFALASFGEPQALWFMEIIGLM